MFAFLKRRKGRDLRDLEQVIFDVAEHQRDSDFHLLYALLSGREVYVPVVNASLPVSAAPGVPFVTRASDRVAFRTVSLPKIGVWAPAATLSSHPMLSSSYVGMQWLEFLRMTGKVAEVRGAALQGKSSWVALDKQRIAYVLSKAGA